MARLLNIFGVFCIIATGNGAKLSLNNLEAFEDAIGNDRIQLGDQVPASSFTGALVLYVDGKYSQPFCTASLITRNRVLTAAHCFESWFNNPRVGLKFVFGLTDIREENLNYHVNTTNVNIIPFDYLTEVFNHENYTGPSNAFENDISIIKLNTPVTAKLARPIKLANKDYTDDIYVNGWGRKNCTHASVETLRRANGKLLTQEGCNSALADFRQGVEFSDSQICAFFTTISHGEAAIAPGDSGGPLYHAHLFTTIQIGVSSHVVTSLENYDEGWRCTNKLYPQTFTRVSSFETWIKGHAPEAKFG